MGLIQQHLDYATKGVGSQPRALGEAHLAVSRRGESSAIRDLRQSGALKLIFPRCYDSPAKEAVLINTAGGITGGDRFFLTADVGAGADLRMTTQAAERVYRALDGAGQVSTRITVGSSAQLHWLPQETILFDGAALRRRLDISLATDAELLLVEPIVFGRQAMGEDLTQFLLDDRIVVRRNDAPIYLDGMRLTKGSDLNRPALAGGAGAAAQIVFVAPRAEAQMDAVRAHLTQQGGASLMRDDMLVVRLLAEDSFALRQSLLPILDLLTDNQMPTSWRL